MDFDEEIQKKSRIWETPNLSTDADSSIDTCLPAATANGAGNTAVQYSAVQYSEVQCSAVQCSAVQCCAVQCIAAVKQCSSVQ